LEIGNYHGGEGGIRTHGTVSRSQHFQCCQFNHSCTSPIIANCRFPIANLVDSVITKLAIDNWKLAIIMAERVGFEPTVGVNPLRFSRPVH
jgi:hypothetical protein